MRRRDDGVLQTIGDTPGLQYVVVSADAILFEFARGWADIGRQRPMTLDTTLMAYSMTKTFTAVAVQQLCEQGRVTLDAPLAQYLPDAPYGGRMTIRQLLAHTAGIPNPIPLRWVHLVEEHAAFDEAAALAQVLAAHPRLACEPGQKYRYSNIGYWLLGRVIEQVTGQPYITYMRQCILQPLRLAAGEMDFVIHDARHHAQGYLAKYSLLNLLKGFVTDRRFLGAYEGRWLRLESHYLNGPAFGGLVGAARAFGRFLQDQLRAESVLLSPAGKQMLQAQQTESSGAAIPVTLGWHVGQSHIGHHFFKEGGGGGFHCEMRLYPAQGIGSVVMANSTTFNTTRFLADADGAFLS